MWTRTLGAILRESERSILLLGPRQVGKSTLVASLQPDLVLNLARESLFLELAADPREFERRVLEQSARRVTIFIDEVQRLPSLLNSVQALIDEKPGRYRFLLTGSSARKLKRGNANLLPGRIDTYAL